MGRGPFFNNASYVKACPYYPPSAAVAFLFEGATYFMLTEPDGDGDSFLESHHAVLPISNMIPKELPQNNGSVVESVEVHIISINKSASMVIDNNSARSRADSLASHGIRQDAIKPRWVRRHIVFGGKIDGACIEVLPAISSNVELFKI
jgi:hypothetical protein